MRWLLGRLALIIWAGGLLSVGSTLMAGHWVSLPLPDTMDPAIRSAVAARRLPMEQDRWLALHVLYSECPCSRRIFDHVLTSARPAGISERILLIGEDAEMAAQARAAGFPVEVLGQDALVARYHLTAAPALLIASPEDEIRYLGGYTLRKQGPEIQDVSLIERAQAAGRPLAALPLFGCAVSQSLQDALDPMGIKYGVGL